MTTQLSPQPLDKFIESVASARYEEARLWPGATVESVGAFEQMQAYVLDLYRGVNRSAARAGPAADITEGAARMTDSPPRAAETLRQVWSTPVPDTGARTLVASSDTIVLGTGRGEETDLSGSLVVLDARTGDIARAQHDYWLVGPLALSPDGQWLAAAEHPEFSSGRTQPGDADRIRILDVKTGDERCRHAGAVPADIRALAYSLDGRSVAAIGSGDVLVFDAASGAERWRVHLDGAWNGLAWSPDGKTVAVGYRDGIAILDEGFGTQRPNAPSAPGVGALAYSQDGARIVAGCWDGTIRAFDADSGARAVAPRPIGHILRRVRRHQRRPALGHRDHQQDPGRLRPACGNAEVPANAMR